MTTTPFDHLLWPPSNNNWMAPGALAGMRSHPVPDLRALDVGALTQAPDGTWMILQPGYWYPEHNTIATGWVPFDPANSGHIFDASAFRRYGPGVSYGPGHNGHDEVVGYFEDLYGRTPSPMEKMDIEHNKAAWEALEKAYREKNGIVIGPPPVEPPPPPDPPPAEPPPPVEPPPPIYVEVPRPLSAEARETLDLMLTWRGIGAGRHARLARLRQELLQP